jgi:tetratricopeptide (TPR) repeat protein
VRTTLRSRSGPLIALLAARKNEEAWEHENFDRHGAFSYFLLRALNTAEADSIIRDNRISVSELLRYIRNGVEDGTLDRQHPTDFIEVDSLRTEVMAEIGPPGIPVSLKWDPMPPEAFSRKKRLPVAARTASEKAPPLSDAELRALIELEDRGQEILQRYLEGDEYPPAQSDFERGAAIYEKALQLAPGSIDLESRRDFFLGRVRIFQKRYADAVDLLERAVRLDPGSAVAYNALGIAYLEQAEYPRAILAFEDAIRRSIYWAYPRHNLALALTEAGEYDEAVRTYEIAMDLAPQYSYLPHNLGLVYQRMNRLRDAARYYRRAVRLAPERAAPYIALGVLNSSERQLREALDLLARHPDPDKLAIARHSLALLLSRRRGRFDEAVRLWRENIAAADYLPSRFSLAEALADRHPAQAVTEYEEIARRNPKNVAVRLRLAALLRGRPDRAREHLRAALSLELVNPLLYVRLAELEAAENPGRARKLYDEALCLTTDPEMRHDIERARKKLP